MEAIMTRYFRSPESGRPVQVSVFLDTDPRDSPRVDHEVFTALVTFDRSYVSPDRDLLVSELYAAVSRFSDPWSVDAGMVARFAGIFLADEVVFVGGLRRDYGGSLVLYAGDELTPGDRYEGIAVVTRSGWQEAMGADYVGPVTPRELVEDELTEYNAWAGGEIYGYVTTEASDDSADINEGAAIDQSWAMIGEPDYAMAVGVISVLGGRSVNGGRGWQGECELTGDEFDLAMQDWHAQHGHRVTGTGWPRA